MKTLDKGKDKIDQICQALRKETIEPAQKEGEKIVSEAKDRANKIIIEAEKVVEKLHEDARADIVRERNVFHSSLSQAVSQSMEALRQEIENKLFNRELQSTLEAATADPKVITRLIEAVIKALDKEGVSTDLSAVIPRAIPADEVNSLLAESILKKLKEKSVTLGAFTGGAQVKLLDKKMTLDITDEALRELLASYVRKDFRKLLFAE